MKKQKARLAEMIVDLVRNDVQIMFEKAVDGCLEIRLVHTVSGETASNSRRVDFQMMSAWAADLDTLLALEMLKVKGPYGKLTKWV